MNLLQRLSIFAFLKQLYLIFILFKKNLFSCGCAGFPLLRGLSLVTVSRGWLSSWWYTGFSCVVPSVVEHGLQGMGALVLGASGALEHRLDSCSTQAWLLCRMWDLPRPGIELMSPALVGKFFITEPPGNPSSSFLEGDILNEKFFVVIWLMLWWS